MGIYLPKIKILLILVITLIGVIYFSGFKGSNNSISNEITDPIVFVSRNLQLNGNINFPSAGLLPGMGPYSRFKVVGGRLLIRETNGNIISLVDSTMNFNGITIYDVQQPCVHWSGTKLLFAGVEHPDSSWRIYEINTNGTGFRKVTHTDRVINLSQFGPAAFRFEKYDDIDPIYAPDDNIIFTSTRYPSLSEIGAFNTTNLFLLYNDTAIYRMTTERNSAEKPSIDPTNGLVVYSRWWVNIDMPTHLTQNGLTRDSSQALNTDIGNTWQTGMIKNDGDILRLQSGDPRNRKSLYLYRPRIMQNGDLLGVFTPDISMTSTSGSNGIRHYKLGLSAYEYVLGTDTNTSLYQSSPPSYGTLVPPYATDPVELPDGKIMLSYATSVESLDYGIYSCNLDGSGLTQIVDLPGTLELNAEVIKSRPVPNQPNYLLTFDQNNVPPTTDPNTFYQGGLFRFDCLNVFANAPVDTPIGNAPPITTNAKIRFFLQFQRQDPNGKDSPILFRETAVDYDGKVIQGDIPANVSMFEQITDSNGNVLVNSKGDVAHVTGMNFGTDGSGTKCVGCHAGHTLIKVPINITEGNFTNVSTSATVTESSFLSTGPDQFKGENAVDRKARNQDLKVNWIAGNNSPNQYIDLNWDIYIDIRKLRLYNIIPNPSNNTDIQVQDCEIFLYRDSVMVDHIASTGPLTTDGLIIPFSSPVTVTSMRVIVKNYTGTINNLDLPGLAEVEVEARIGLDNYVGIDPIAGVPTTFNLEQNYPNPFNPITTIRFSIPKKSHVSMKVYDINGKEIETLIEGNIDAGNSSIVFNGSRFASGVYFYRITAGDFVQTKKMVLIK